MNDEAERRKVDIGALKTFVCFSQFLFSCYDRFFFFFPFSPSLYFLSLTNQTKPNQRDDALGAIQESYRYAKYNKHQELIDNLHQRFSEGP